MRDKMEAIILNAPSEGAAADAIIDALPDLIPDLEWEDPDRNGGLYTNFSLGANFSGYYQIDQEDFDLATVSFGVVCHEFGDTVVWKGPKNEAKAAANAHHKAAIMAALGVS